MYRLVPHKLSEHTSHVIRASGPRVQFVGCKNAPVVYSTDRSKAMVPVLFFVALWFILRGDLF